PLPEQVRLQYAGWRVGDGGEALGVDADRKDAEPHASAKGVDRVVRASAAAELAGEDVEEVAEVALGLESDQIIRAQAAHQIQAPGEGQPGECVRTRKRGVQEEAQRRPNSG